MFNPENNKNNRMKNINKKTVFIIDPENVFNTGKTILKYYIIII